MFALTHTQLERLSAFVDGIEGINSYPYAQQLDSFKSDLNNKVTESKMIFAITLRYPTTQIESSVIHWVIKHARPTQEQLNAFYSEQGII